MTLRDFSGFTVEILCLIYLSPPHGYMNINFGVRFVKMGQRQRRSELIVVPDEDKAHTQGLDTPNTTASFLSCFCLKFYRLPTTRCENDTICHAFLSSFTVYRHEKTRRFLVCQVLTHQQRFAVALSVNGKTSK